MYSQPPSGVRGLLGEEVLPPHAPRHIVLNPHGRLFAILHVKQPRADLVELARTRQFRSRGRGLCDDPEHVEGASLNPSVRPRFLSGLLKAAPPSDTTTTGGAIRFMRASHAREFSLLATYQPNTWARVWAINTTALRPKCRPSTKTTSWTSSTTADKGQTSHKRSQRLRNDLPPPGMSTCLAPPSSQARTLSRCFAVASIHCTPVE